MFSKSGRGSVSGAAKKEKKWKQKRASVAPEETSRKSIGWSDVHVPADNIVRSKSMSARSHFGVMRPQYVATPGNHIAHTPGASILHNNCDVFRRLSKKYEKAGKNTRLRIMTKWWRNKCARMIKQIHPWPPKIFKGLFWTYGYYEDLIGEERKVNAAAYSDNIFLKEQMFSFEKEFDQDAAIWGERGYTAKNVEIASEDEENDKNGKIKNNKEEDDEEEEWIHHYLNVGEGGNDEADGDKFLDGGSAYILGKSRRKSDYVDGFEESDMDETRTASELDMERAVEDKRKKSQFVTDEKGRTGISMAKGGKEKPVEKEPDTNKTEKRESQSWFSFLNNGIFSFNKKEEEKSEDEKKENTVPKMGEKSEKRDQRKSKVGIDTSGDKNRTATLIKPATKPQTEEPKKSPQEPRKNAEELKKSAQEPKKNAEELRKSAEESKRNAEELRKSTEESKRKAEESKRNAEELRKSAEESKRKAEESKRNTEELKKSTQEPIMKNAEELKKSAQEPKKNAEELKKSTQEPKKNVEEPKKNAEQLKKSAEQPKKVTVVPTVSNDSKRRKSNFDKDANKDDDYESSMTNAYQSTMERTNIKGNDNTDYDFLNRRKSGAYVDDSGFTLTWRKSIVPGSTADIDIQPPKGKKVKIPEENKTDKASTSREQKGRRRTIIVVENPNIKRRMSLYDPSAEPTLVDTSDDDEVLKLFGDRTFERHYLHISNLSEKATKEDLKDIFPTGVITLTKAPGNNTAVVHFEKAIDTKQAFLDSKNILLYGVPLFVSPKLKPNK